MKSLNPLNWFKKGEPFTWVELTPGQPFAGLARFSGEAKCPYPVAVKLSGIGPEDAMAAFCGRVVDFSKLDPKAMKAARQGAKEMDVDGLRGIFR